METQYEKIVQAANSLFLQFGIRSVSVDDVCAELHMSKKTFYVHFAQKEDLVDVVLTYQENINLEKFNKLFKKTNAIDSLIIFIKELKKELEKESPPLCYDLEKYYPKVFEKHELIKNEEMRQGFEKNLRQGITEGFYRNDLDIELISLFHSMQIRQTFEQMKLSSKKYSKKRLVDFFFDLMIHLIANENGLKYMEKYAKLE